MPERSSRYLLDSNVFIAAVKHEWTKSTELIYHLLNRPVELFANDLLIFEYEKYARTLGTHELLNYMKKSLIQVNPSQEEIDACAPFFPESELSDIIHAATCLYADAILITNDNHFAKIKKSKLVEVWSNTKATKYSSTDLTITETTDEMGCLIHRPLNRESLSSFSPQLSLSAIPLAIIWTEALIFWQFILLCMFFEYIQAAISKAVYEVIDDEEPYYGEVFDLKGVWATGKTQEECRENLRMAIEDWIAFSLRFNLPIPAMKARP